MFDFKIPEISDYHWVKECQKAKGPVGSEEGFGTAFLWNKAFSTYILHYKDSMIIRYDDEKFFTYVLPYGKYPLTELIALVRDDAQKFEKPFVLSGFAEEDVKQCKKEMPDYLDFFPLDDLFDYIYKAENLANLPGRKFHGKRNHLAKFKRLYPNYQCHNLSKDDSKAVFSIFDRWAQENEFSPMQEEERNAISLAMENFDELELSGIYITIDDEPVAFAMGEALNHETYDIHFEKALTQYDGLYAAVNQEFAKILSEKYEYINREEDMGIEGLRKAKLSYHPDILLKKFGATVQGE